MSRQSELNSYIERVRGRLRLVTTLQGAAILTGAALVTTVVIVLVLNAFAFPEHSITKARLILGLVLVCVAAFALAWPLLRLTRRRSIALAEAARPELEQRLVTFEERQGQGNEPFIELLAADTLKMAEDTAAPKSLVPDNRLMALAGVGVACVAVLVWMIAARPGYLGYGASLLWMGPKKNVAPLYDIKVTPGNVAVRRNSDQMITAQVIGLIPDKVQLYARYQSALVKFGKDGGWEPVAMQADMNGGAQHFQFLLTGLPEDVEYYVQAGPIKSEHFKVRVVDLPGVKQINVTYHYPKWTGMKDVTEERSGDLRAIEGTDAELSVEMDRPLKDGLLVLDSGEQLHLAGDGKGNLYKGTVQMSKDGAYHVAGVDQGQQVRLSEDYFISSDKAVPPQIAIDRPGRDYRASPIEEVTVGVQAGDQFGLRNMELHYSVNGGPEKTVNMLKEAGAKSANGSTTLSLEDFKLVPGDLVSLYATAADGHQDARTDMMFIQADPFEREFSQSQSGGGGGGGGGGGQQGGNQTDISRRQKELISETFKRQNNKTATAKENTDAGAFLSEVQGKLRGEVQALQVRMESRDLSSANEEFNSFNKDMEQASQAMVPASEKLGKQQWKDAMPLEQKALQYLLRAEATFRQIEVAFGRQGGGGGGGGGGNAGRDLASLFDLELDTEKNQYETAPQGSAEEQRAKQVDDALQKLDALARRQEELAQQQRNGQQTFEQRWQQEMLRREAEQLQREMEQMAQQGQQGQQGQQRGQPSQSSQGGQAGQQSSQARSQNGQSGQQQANNNRNGADPRLQQALDRLKDANNEMTRNGQQQRQSQDAAQRAADSLSQARSLMGGTQAQQAGNKLDSLTQEAQRLGQEEKTQADRIHQLAQQGQQNGATTQQDYARRVQQRDQLVNDRQQMSDDLSKLQRGMRDTARDLGPTQPSASGKLRDALSGMDQDDLDNLVQRTADWLREGRYSDDTEATITKDLQKLNDNLKQAQQAAGNSGAKPGQNPQSQGEQIAALDHLERLRQSLNGIGGNQNGQRPGQNGQQGQQNDQRGQNGQQQGQNGQQGQGNQQGQRAGQQLSRNGQSGQNGQQGQGPGQQGQQQANGQRGQQGQQQGQGQQQAQNGQRGQGQQGQGQQGQGQQGQQQGQGQGRGGQQQAQGGQQVQGQQGQQGQGQGRGGQQQAQNGRGGNDNQNGQLNRGGDLGGAQRNGGGVIDGNRGNRGGYGVGADIDTGGQTYTMLGPPPADNSVHQDAQKDFQQAQNELAQLHHLAQSDPQAAKDVENLAEELKKLDPNRFKGNPDMVEALHSQVLGEVDKLELQLRHDVDAQSTDQVRTAKPSQVPPGYQDAVAEYYRRLSRGQQSQSQHGQQSQQP